MPSTYTSRSKSKAKSTRKGSDITVDEAENRARLTAYRPTKKDVDLRTEAYALVQDMIDLKNEKRHQFNGPDGDRNIMEYVNDSEKRVNGYTPTRAAQDKDEWQANMFNPVTRTKLKAIVAAVALQPPQQNYMAVNKEGMFSVYRAELVKQLVKYSRNSENPALDIFFEAWEAAVKGTVIKYDGYLKSRQMRKFITSFDMTTGEVEFDEREVLVEDRPIDIQVPIAEFFVKDDSIFNVQDQPAVAWIKNYNKEDLEAEFSHYPNFQFVKDKKSVGKFNTAKEGYFYESWQSRVKECDEYEVVRLYRKQKDQYEIWINGVKMLVAPMLWGYKTKLYPFSKTIFEPFGSKNCFWGMSLPGLLQSNQDITNVIWNSILDKLYRSLEVPMLVGLANKDLLDIEDELVNQDNKIYVPDINQVKPYPLDKVSQSDIQMLHIVARAADLMTVDSNQQGAQGSGNPTAREVLIADEHARKLKGIFFMFLEDLWLQKTRIRIPNILMNMMRVKQEAVIGEDGAKVFKDILTIYNVKNATFSDGTKGTLGIQIVKDKKSLPQPWEIEAKENAMQEQGIDYKLIAVPEDYVDEWDIDFQVTTDSIFNADKIRRAAEVDEKQSKMIQLYPEIFVANKDRMFDEFVEVYGDSGDEYKRPAPTPPAGDPNAESILGGEGVASKSELALPANLITQ